MKSSKALSQERIKKATENYMIVINALSSLMINAENEKISEMYHYYLNDAEKRLQFYQGFLKNDKESKY